jgi:hypothetical protein
MGRLRLAFSSSALGVWLCASVTVFCPGLRKVFGRYYLPYMWVMHCGCLCIWEALNSSLCKSGSDWPAEPAFRCSPKRLDINLFTIGRGLDNGYRSFMGMAAMVEAMHAKERRCWKQIRHCAHSNQHKYWPIRALCHSIIHSYLHTTYICLHLFMFRFFIYLYIFIFLLNTHLPISVLLYSLSTHF